MKILIAADMEGVSGVVHWDHVDSKHADYGRFRKAMTRDVNAAIEGAFDAGADEALVSDGHGNGRNILVEKLDLRARLNSGSPAPWAMVQGVDSGVDAVLFVGYHARAGTQNAILDHTWTASLINLWLNERLVGEIGLNAALCGHFGLPVILIAGDQSACAEALELLGPIETAVVKQAHGRMAAECLPPSIAQQRIRDAAERAVRRFLAGDSPAPLRLKAPLTVTVEFNTSDRADRAAVFPGAQRLAGRRVSVAVDDVPTAYCAFRSLAALSRP